MLKTVKLGGKLHLSMGFAIAYLYKIKTCFKGPYLFDLYAALKGHLYGEKHYLSQMLKFLYFFSNLGRATKSNFIRVKSLF